MSSTFNRRRFSQANPSSGPTLQLTRHRRSRSRTEQENRDIQRAFPNRLFRVPEIEATHATFLLRLSRSILRQTTLSVLRDGHRLVDRRSQWPASAQPTWSQRLNASITFDTEPNCSRLGVERLAGRVWEYVERCCTTSKADDKRTPNLFKVKWNDDGLCNNT